MAQVIHTIKGKQYLYEHKREGDKVVCKYVGPVGSGGKVRAAQHGGGAPAGVTQQTDIQIKDNTTNKGKTINNKKDNSMIGQEAQEKSTMNQIHDLGKNWKMESEEIYVSHMGTTSSAVKYMVLDPDEKEIKTITEQDKIMPDDVNDKFEDVLRPYNKRRELRYRGTVREGGQNLESRNMYYLTGNTRDNKEQIKQAGFKWEPELTAWSSIHKPDFEIEGVNVEMKPTYKSKNAWTYYQ